MAKGIGLVRTRGEVCQGDSTVQHLVISSMNDRSAGSWAESIPNYWASQWVSRSGGEYFVILPCDQAVIRID